MKKELKLLLMAAALFMMAGGLFGPIYAVFVENIGGDLLTAGAAYSVFAIVSGVIIFFLGKWEDKVKHQENLIIFGYALSCLGYVGYLLIKEPWHLFLVQMVFGLGGAIGTPAYDGMYSKYLDKGKFASQWGAWESMAWIVTGIAALLGGFIANSYGFRILFIIMLVFSIIGFFISLLLIRKKKKR